MSLLFGKKSLTILAGGLAFCTVFYLRYAFIDPDLYQYRDDGVITMSVGRHIVDYGFVGVSPSGPIVEASSSPLQTMVYAALYFFFDINYAQYSALQTYASAFFIGMIFSAFFVSQPFIALGATLLAAIGLSFIYPFFLWHASGMENALTHAIYLLSIFIFYKSVRDQKISFLLAVPIFFATIVRIESVLHISLLLIFFTTFWWWLFRNFRALMFSALVGSFWLLFQIFRYTYFGDIVPNTGYAQDIAVTERLASLFAGNFHYISNSLRVSHLVFVKQGWWIGLIFIPLYFLVKKEPSSRFLLLSTLLVFLSISASPFLFGQARIDPTRTTTQLTLLVVLAVFYSAFHTRSRRKVALYAVLAIPLLLVSYSISGLSPYYLGWSTKGFDNVRIRFQEIAKEHQIYRPTVSNPDLGIMTWHKRFNVIDLGMLGTPEMAKLGQGNWLMLSQYFLEYGLPDIIESHGYWTKRYCKSIFLAKEFSDQYEILDSGNSSEDLCEMEDPSINYWIRKDIKIGSTNRERRFLETLQDHLDVSGIEEEIKACAGLNESCRYIARTVFKFIPELRENGWFDNTVNLFDVPSERAMLLGWKDAQAHRLILEAVGDN